MLAETLDAKASFCHHEDCNKLRLSAWQPPQNQSEAEKLPANSARQLSKKERRCYKGYASSYAATEPSIERPTQQLKDALVMST
jgi:hypothetical protein